MAGTILSTQWTQENVVFVLLAIDILARVFKVIFLSTVTSWTILKPCGQVWAFSQFVFTRVTVTIHRLIRRTISMQQSSKII